jgi:hypothetical protein
MIFIDSIYINSSGGKYLLEYFIQKISKQSNINEYIFLFDNRFDSNITSLIPSQNIYHSNSSEFSRYSSFPKLQAMTGFAGNPIGVKCEVVGNIFGFPCRPDHNGECLICDCWLSDCPMVDLVKLDKAKKVK